MKLSKLPQLFTHKTLSFGRNGLTNRKYRRHVNDASHLNHQKTTRRMHPGTYSSSQLSIEVSELHAGTNGRLEITCLSTIPASVGVGEEYADYKTFSVKGKPRRLKTNNKH